MLRRVGRGLALLAGLALAPHAGWGVEKIDFTPGWNLFSPRDDVQLGGKGAVEIERQLPLLNDRDAADYVVRLGKRLVGFAPNNRAEYAWQFKVVNSAEINAFALPGGYIYVNRGAIEAADNEAELAGILAHESGHVVMRHGTNIASHQLLLQVPLALIGGILGQSDSLMSQLTQLGIGVGMNSLLLKYSRSSEAQADEVGTYILCQAGYDPRAMVQFFQIVEKKYPQRTLQFFSDHPKPENRIQDVEAEIRKLAPPPGAKTDSTEFETLKGRLAQLAPSPQHFATIPSGSPAPPPPASKRLVRYDGKVFTLEYPENWQVQKSEDGVALYPPGGMVTGSAGDTAQAYGAAVSRTHPAGENWGLVEATQQLLNAMRQSNPDLRVVRETGMNVRGRPAVSILMHNVSPLPGETETDRLVTLRQGDCLLSLIFIAPEKAFESYAPTFDQILYSLETTN